MHYSLTSKLYCSCGIAEVMPFSFRYSNKFSIVRKLYNLSHISCVFDHSNLAFKFLVTLQKYKLYVISCKPWRGWIYWNNL